MLKDTRLAYSLQKAKSIQCIDDLFYRGRTLYSLATILKAFGADPRKIKLTTIACDEKSRNLHTPYSKTLNRSALYPFENSVRTEQGYWQDIGDMHIYTDMGAYWEFLHESNSDKSNNAYVNFIAVCNKWFTKNVDTALNNTLVFPLVWLIVYHKRYNIPINVPKVVDQKGYKIGACAPFVELLHHFVSQEETVAVRRNFKHSISYALQSIEDAIQKNPVDFDRLIQEYRSQERQIDYGSLTKLFTTNVR